LKAEVHSQQKIKKRRLNNAGQMESNEMMESDVDQEMDENVSQNPLQNEEIETDEIIPQNPLQIEGIEMDENIPQNPLQNAEMEKIPHLDEIDPKNSDDMYENGDRRMILDGRNLQGDDLRVKFDELEMPLKPKPNRNTRRSCIIPFLEDIYPNTTLCDEYITVNVCVMRQNGVQSNCLPFIYKQGKLKASSPLTIIELLIASGEGKPFIRRKEGKTKLTLVELLDQNRINLTAIDELGRTFLHYSAIMGNSNDTENILKHYSKNINQQDIYGCTALHFAVFRRNKKMVESLITNGADPTLIDDNMESCLDRAYQFDLDEIIDIMEHHITIKEEKSNEYIGKAPANKIPEREREQTFSISKEIEEATKIYSHFSVHENMETTSQSKVNIKFYL
jgi:hypothetical protein